MSRAIYVGILKSLTGHPAFYLATLIQKDHANGGFKEGCG